MILIGHLTRDPEIRYSQSQNSICIARYILAVDRRYKRDSEAQADFIRCVAFGKSGEFAEKYLHKGMKIAVIGRIITGSYINQDGQKVYTTEVTVEQHEFVEGKVSSRSSGGDIGSQEYDQSTKSAPRTSESLTGGFVDPDEDDDDLPF